MFSGFHQCFQAFFNVFKISKAFINLSAATSGGSSKGHMRWYKKYRLVPDIL